MNETIKKLLCKLGYHDYEFVKLIVLGGRGNGCYWHKCKRCGNDKSAFFGNAYNKKRKLF